MEDPIDKDNGKKQDRSHSQLDKKKTQTKACLSHCQTTRSMQTDFGILNYGDPTGETKEKESTCCSSLLEKLIFTIEWPQCIINVWTKKGE